jgi:hypothetical protein
MTLDWALTLAGFLMGGAVMALASWRAGKPAVPMRPRLLPWTFVILAAAFWLVLMGVHAVNLLGVETGPALIQRGGPAP